MRLNGNVVSLDGFRPAIQKYPTQTQESQLLDWAKQYLLLEQSVEAGLIPEMDAVLHRANSRRRLIQIGARRGQLGFVL